MQFSSLTCFYICTDDALHFCVEYFAEASFIMGARNDRGVTINHAFSYRASILALELSSLEGSKPTKAVHVGHVNVR